MKGSAAGPVNYKLLLLIYLSLIDDDDGVKTYHIQHRRSWYMMCTRAFALISIFPRRHNDRVVTLICAWECLLLLLLFLNATAADATPSRPSPTAAVRPSPADTFHNVCSRSQIIRHRLTAVRGAHLGSRTPRGVAQIGFSGRLR